MGRSSCCQCWRARVSYMLPRRLFHRTSWGVLWFLKILLFLSFQIVQRVRPGISLHKELSKLLLYGAEGQLRMVEFKSPGVLPSLLHLKMIFSQRKAASGQVTIRCWIVSSRSVQLGHREGPVKPLLMRLSQVRILLWHKSHMKVETLGQRLEDQRLSQMGSMGSWLWVKSVCASWVLNFPLGVYPHLRRCFSSEYLIFLQLSSVSRALWEFSCCWFRKWAAHFHCLNPWLGYVVQ